MNAWRNLFSIIKKEDNVEGKLTIVVGFLSFSWIFCATFNY